MNEIEIERTFDSDLVDRFANHPDILPFVKDRVVGPIITKPLVDDPANYFLVGEHGGMFFEAILPGLYEAHIFVKKEGRGAWTASLLHQCVAAMFTATDCTEIVGKQPRGFISAMALWRMVGGTIDFVVDEPLIKFRGKLLPYTAWGLRLQDWVRTSPLLRALGQQVLSKLSDFSGIDLPENEAAERTFGAVHMMAASGRVWKALTIYNRYAVLGRAVLGTVDRERPSALRIGDILLSFDGGVVGVESCRWEEPSSEG